MISFFKEWIIGITAVSILTAAVQSLLPQGNIKKVGNIASGLVLLLSIATPLFNLEAADLSAAITEFRLQENGHSELLAIENKALVKRIIEEQTAAYISDKATELGAKCTIEVSYSYSDNGTAYLSSVVIVGDLSPEQKKYLSEYLEREFSISEVHQTYKGAGEYAAK